MQNPRFCLIMVIGLPINSLPVRAGRKALCSWRYSDSTVGEVFFFFTLRTVYVPNWQLSLAIPNTFPRPDKASHPTFYRWVTWGPGQDIPPQLSRHGVQSVSTQLLRWPGFQVTIGTWLWVGVSEILIPGNVLCLGMFLGCPVLSLF